MTLQHPAEVQLSAELAKAGFAPLAPLTVSLQIDALDIQSFPLTPFAPVARTNFALPEGPHLVRVWIADPVVNQFVRIGFGGQSEAGHQLDLVAVLDGGRERKSFLSFRHRDTADSIFLARPGAAASG